MSASLPFCVFVIDDDEDTRENLRDILELDGYQVETAGTISEALGRKDWERISAVLLDRRLPDGTAEDALPQIKRLAPHVPILIVTGYADLDGAIAAIRHGAADYITKPVNAELLRKRLALIAERGRAEREIVRLHHDVEQRVNELQALLDVIPIGIGIAENADCTRIRANPTLAKILRIPTTGNASVSAPENERPAFRVCCNGRELPDNELPMQVAASRGIEVRDIEVDIVHPDGDVINLYCYAAPLFDKHGSPRGAVGAFLDVTERKRAHERQMQTERLAAIGQMMTGLAHESGNALARSQACLEMLALEVPDRSEALELINRAQKAQDHLQHLYDDVRGYAAPIKLEREPWRLSLVWRQAWDNLSLRRQGRDASFHEETCGMNLECAIDQFRLGQVFRNIFENSLAACADPVQIQIRATETELNGKTAVTISVLDNGPGLAPEQRQRIFEPFFTTKTKGTGLGMAIAQRIVEAHGGRIAVGESRSEGAEILITLPREA